VPPDAKKLLKKLLPPLAIFSSFITQKSSFAGALPRTPLGELTALPQASSWIQVALFLRGERKGRGNEREGQSGRQVQLIQRSAYMYKWNVVPLNFNFHKVVRQQNSGAVEDFILPYSAVYLRIQKWKNYW